MRIIRIDPARKRIGLSMRRVESDDGNYPVDDDAYDYDPDELEREIVATVGAGVQTETVATDVPFDPSETAVIETPQDEDVPTNL